MVDTSGGGVEIVIGCCLGTKHAITHFNHIQIHLHDAFLAPKELYQDREICLYCFAQVGARVESEDVLSRLLGDRAASACDAAVALVELVGTADGVPIEAAVVVELGVLVVDDSGDEVGGDILEGCPLMLYLQVATLLVCLDMAEQHERREGHGDEPEEQDEGDTAEEEGQQEVGEETAKHVTLQKL